MEHEGELPRPEPGIGPGALLDLARELNLPISGKDFKTGQTFMKTLLAPGFKARMLGISGLRLVGRVHGPLLKRPLTAAMLLVFVDVMKELPATFIMRPFNFDTLAVQAYHYASDERLPQAAAASLVIVAVGLIPVILLTRGVKGRR